MREIEKSEVIKLFSLYRKELVKTELSNRTINKYEKDVEQFIQSIENSLSLNDVFKYKIELMKKYKITTVNSKLISINKFLTWAKCEDMKLKLCKVQSRYSLRNVLTKKEYEKLIKTANVSNEKIYYIIRTIASTGIRVSELEHITVEAVRCGVATVNSKGKVRDIYISEQLSNLLRKYIETRGIVSGSIFIGNKNRPITPSYIWKEMKTIGKKSEITLSHIYPHSLRHLFAKEYMNIYGNITELADILGHSSLETTRIYTKSSDEEKRKKIGRLGL